MNVRGNRVNGIIHVQLVFRVKGGKDKSVTRDVQIHKRVGDSVEFKPTDFEPYTSHSRNVKINITPKDAPNGDNNRYSDSCKFVYHVEQAAPITVTCIDQNQKEISKQVNGYVDQKGSDITKVSALPKGYHLASHEETEYEFIDQPQTIMLRIVGNHTKGTVHLTLNEVKGTSVLKSTHKNVQVRGLVGDPYQITASLFTPKNTVPLNKAVRGKFTADGITRPNITFRYAVKKQKSHAKPQMQHHLHATGHSSLVIVTVDPKGNQVGSQVVSGNIGQSVDLLKHAYIPKGYVLSAHQKVRDKITADLREVKLTVHKPVPHYSVQQPKPQLKKIPNVSSYAQNTQNTFSSMKSMSSYITTAPSVASVEWPSNIARDVNNVSTLAKDARVGSLITKAMTVAVSSASAANDTKTMISKNKSGISAADRTIQDNSLADAIKAPVSDTYTLAKHKLMNHKTQMKSAKSKIDNQPAYNDYHKLMKEAEDLENQGTLSTISSAASESNSASSSAPHISHSASSISNPASEQTMQPQNRIMSKSEKSTKPSLSPIITKEISNVADNVKSFANSATSYADQAASIADSGNHDALSAKNTDSQSVARAFVLKLGAQLKQALTLVGTANSAAKAVNNSSTYFVDGSQKTDNEIYKLLDHNVTAAASCASKTSLIRNDANHTYNKEKIALRPKPKPRDLIMSYISNYSKNIKNVDRSLMNIINHAISQNVKLKDPSISLKIHSAQEHDQKISSLIQQSVSQINGNNVRQAVATIQAISSEINSLRSIVNYINQRRYKDAMTLYKSTSQKLHKVNKKHHHKHDIGIQAAIDRSVFTLGARDAKVKSHPISKHTKVDHAAYAAGYRAYVNGYYDAAGNFTYYSDRYQGISERAYADGFASGMTFYKKTTKFANSDIIKKNIKQHADTIKYESVAQNNHDVLPPVAHNDKTPEEMKMMAAILGIALNNVVAYDSKHHLEYYDDSYNV